MGHETTTYGKMCHYNFISGSSASTADACSLLCQQQAGCAEFSFSKSKWGCRYASNSEGCCPPGANVAQFCTAFSGWNAGGCQGTTCQFTVLSTNSCRDCQNCNVGKFRFNCEESNPGTCENCVDPIQNAHHTTWGMTHGVDNSCNWACDAGYEGVGGTSSRPAQCVMTSTPTASPTTSPTTSPTPECAASNCLSWSCEQWCKCFDEDAEVSGEYASHGCIDDGRNDDCACGNFY